MLGTGSSCGVYGPKQMYYPIQSCTNGQGIEAWHIHDFHMFNLLGCVELASFLLNMHHWIKDYQTNLFAALSTTRPPTADGPFFTKLKRNQDPRQSPPAPDPKRRRLSRAPDESPDLTDAETLSGNSDAGGEDIQTQDDNPSGYHMNDEDGDGDLLDKELWDAE